MNHDGAGWHGAPEIRVPLRSGPCPPHMPREPLRGPGSVAVALVVGGCDCGEPPGTAVWPQSSGFLVWSIVCAAPPACRSIPILSGSALTSAVGRLDSSSFSVASPEIAERHPVPFCGAPDKKRRKNPPVTQNSIPESTTSAVPEIGRWMVFGRAGGPWCPWPPWPRTFSNVLWPRPVPSSQGD